MIVDVHAVLNVVAADPLNELQQFGFAPIPVLGGDQRVVMRYLLSSKYASKREADARFITAAGILDHEGTVGYMEEEVIVDDRTVTPSSHAQRDSVQLSPLHEIDPQGRFKRCDIHATAADAAPVVERFFADAGFYALVLEKTGRPASVFTAQFLDARLGKRVYAKLLRNLPRLGFFGSLKYEATRRVRTWGGQHMPPILSR